MVDIKASVTIWNGITDELIEVDNINTGIAIARTLAKSILTIEFAHYVRVGYRITESVRHDFTEFHLTEGKVTDITKYGYLGGKVQIDRMWTVNKYGLLA